MDIRAALKIPIRIGTFKPSREGLSAVQLIAERMRWYDGLPQDPDMDWQIKGETMSGMGRHVGGPWSCVDCRGEAVYEHTHWGNYYIHQCPNWKPTERHPLDRERSYNEQVDDGVAEWIKRHDMNSGGFGGL